MLGDKIALNLTNEEPTNMTNVQADFSLNNTVKNLMDAVENGTLNDIVINNEKVTIRNVTACRDLQCQETVLDVTTDSQHDTTTAETRTTDASNDGEKNGKARERS